MTMPPCSRLWVVPSSGSSVSLSPRVAGAGGEPQCVPDVGGVVLNVPRWPAGTCWFPASSNCWPMTSLAGSYFGALMSIGGTPRSTTPRARPTGETHMGSGRTLLYNFLSATQNGGTLLLRIQHTDQERYDPRSLPSIYE